MSGGRRIIAGVVVGAVATLTAGRALAAEAATVDTVIVTARLRVEDAQSVPGGLSVVGAETLQKTGTYSASQITQLVPNLNYSSPNPRNTSLTIRGLGSSVVAIAQSNDGLEPGVGFYVDQVYHARPATAAFDHQGAVLPVRGGGRAQPRKLRLSAGQAGRHRPPVGRRRRRAAVGDRHQAGRGDPQRAARPAAERTR
jgi:hypothetical protein